MSDEEKLTAELKTYVTEDMKKAMEAIAKARGPGVKVTQLMREAIGDYLAKHAPKKAKK